jgi:hypothetical protein
MRLNCKTKIAIALVALCLAVGFVIAQFAIAQAPGPQSGGGGMAGRGGGAVFLPILALKL